MEDANAIVTSYKELQEEGNTHDYRDEEHGDYLHYWYESICKRVEILAKHTRNAPGVFQGYKELVDIFNYFKEKHHKYHK
jgi:hypothetical protein